MLTQTQIQNFIVKAKAAGFTPAQIQQEIVRKQNEVGTQPAGQNVPNQTQPNTPAPQAPIPQMEQQQAPVTQQPVQQEQEDKNFVQKFFKALTDPAIRYGQFVGEAAGQAGRAIFKGKERNELFAKADAGTATEQDLQRLKELTEPIFMPQERFEKLDTPAGIATETLKSTAGGASYVIPGGTGWKSLIAAGAVSGGLFNLSQDESEGIDVENIIRGAITGGATAGILGAVGKGVKGLVKKAAKGLEDRAAQGITRATPTKWAETVSRHGLDLNELTKKYFPKGGTYDDLLGKIDERGSGGIFGSKIKTAEKVIDKTLEGTDKNLLPVDDLITKLKEEQELLSIMPGNESNAEALQQFIEAVQTKYAKGIAPRTGLTLKRAADSKFGKAVADEEAGSVVAQAQKMFANSMRRKLKEAYPSIKDALDTETEIYTLRPILERARGITQTPGSTIRVGRIDTLADLVNPMAWLEKAMGTEQFASKFLRGSENVPLSSIEPAKTGLVKKGTEMAKEALTRPNAAAIAATAATQPEAAPTEQPAGSPETIETIAPETPTLSRKDQVIQDVFGGMSKQDLLVRASAMGASNKDLKEISDRYDLLVGTDKAGDYTETEQAALDTSFLVDQVANMLETKDIKTGLILAPAESFKGKLGIADQNTLEFNILLGNLKATLAKARAGTSFTDGEKKLLDTYTPNIGDSRQEIEAKIKGLKGFMDNKLQNIGGK